MAEPVEEPEYLRLNRALWLLAEGMRQLKA